MALHARLAHHVFNTFENFKNWMNLQQFDIVGKPERTPILKVGQRVTIKDIQSVYITIQPILNIEDILVPDTKGGFKDQLREDQQFLFPVRTPAKCRMELYPAIGITSTTLNINEILVTQNADVLVDFSPQGENYGRSSTIYVTNLGKVTLNTGAFITDFINGDLTYRKKAGSSVSLNPGSNYLLIMKQSDLVFCIEMGRTSFDLVQDIALLPEEASKTKMPSEYAVSKGLLSLSEKLQTAIENSGGFLIYAGVDPNTSSVVRVKKEVTAEDVSYTVNVESELPKPLKGGIFALTLNNQTSVNVYKAKTLSEPIYGVNPLYLGSGYYGSHEVSSALMTTYPSAPANAIVSNFDTETEWQFSGVIWYDTLRPAQDSVYAHNTKYLGVYNFKKNDALQDQAIHMLFPMGVVGDVVNSSLTGTEWKKTGYGWRDTTNPIGTTQSVPNPKVKGEFIWDPTDPDMVRGGIIYRYKTTLATGTVVGVTNGDDWIYDANFDTWTNTGSDAGTHEFIPNVKYLGEGDYGHTDIESANTLMLTYPLSVTGDIRGNTGTDTDWIFDGIGWSNTHEPLGTFALVPNPEFHEFYTLDNLNQGEISAVFKSKYSTAQIDDVVYYMESGLEWELQGDNKWYNTYRVIYTTSPTVMSSNVLGYFNYLQSWSSPDRTLLLVFPEAKYGNIVYNHSTGTEWELSTLSGLWEDTKNPVGTTATDDPNFIGQGLYKTYPPTDQYILQIAYPAADEGQFVTNMTTGTHWEIRRGVWTNTNGLYLNKWLIQKEGIYEWENMGASPIEAGYLFHLTTRYPDTDRSEKYWFANSWNTLDLEALKVDPFTNYNPGILIGAQSFGYVEAIADKVGNSLGKVYGLTDKGTGSNFLNDKGQYVPGVTREPLYSNVHIYLNFETGSDTNTGFNAAQAWKTGAKVALYLMSQSPTYSFTPGSPNFPSRITLHVDGNGEGNDLVIENTAHLHILGPGEMRTKGQCTRLHIVNSTVTIGDYLHVRERIVAWRSKLRFEVMARCYGLYLIDSQVEQAALSLLQFGNIGIPDIPTIYIDETSSLHHSTTIDTEAELVGSVAFLHCLGTYVKGAVGKYTSTVKPRQGKKYHFGARTVIVGTTVDWMATNIPYSGWGTVDLLDPITVPGIRTMLGAPNKTGYQIADGRDLADIMTSSGGIMTVDTVYDAYAIDPSSRYLGMFVYIKNRNALYHFKNGVLDKDLEPYFVPHYNITKIVKQCCEKSVWPDSFSWNFVDNDDWLTDRDQTAEPDPVQSYVLSTELDWNTHKYPGKFYIQSIIGQSEGAPNNPSAVNGWWWLDVENHYFNETQLRVVQVARLQSNPATVVARLFENGAWKGWTYEYSLFSG